MTRGLTLQELVSTLTRYTDEGLSMHSIKLNTSGNSSEDRDLVGIYIDKDKESVIFVSDNNTGREK